MLAAEPVYTHNNSISLQLLLSQANMALHQVTQILHQSLLTIEETTNTNSAGNGSCCVHVC